jgi:hypothetical protein
MNRATMRYGRAAALVLIGAPIMGIAGSSQAQNAGPSQAQRALKIVMVPKFTGTAYFAATEKGAKEAVAEMKEKGGRGIYLMRALMDEVHFEEGGTVVKMRKKRNVVATADKKAG